MLLVRAATLPSRMPSRWRWGTRCGAGAGSCLGDHRERALERKGREGITILNRRNRLPFTAQILTTAVIVIALIGAARLASSEEDARAFDEAAELTRFQLEGAARGVEVADPAADDRQGPVEREEP